MVIWTDPAKSDLRAIHDFIASDSKYYANMIFPGPGISGYCLPKDGGLGVWSYSRKLLIFPTPLNGYRCDCC